MAKKFNNTDKLFLELAETLFSINVQKSNDSLWDLDLPPLKLRYMIDDYEDLFEL